MMLRNIAFTMIASTLIACSGSADSSEAGSPSAKDGTKGGREKPGATTAPGPSIDLGTVDAGRDVTFEIPAGTLGFTIVVDADAGEDDFIGVKELRDPGGKVVISDFRDPTNEDARSVTGQSGSGMGVLVYPLIGSTTDVRAGRYTVKLGGSTRVSGAAKGTVTDWSGRVHGVVLLQNGSGAGALDLDVYVPDGLTVGDDSHSINASEASSDRAIGERLDLVFSLYRRLYGIERGDVRFHAIASSAADIDGQENIDRATALATVARRSGQIVLTNRLAPDGDGTEISGISNCLPGAVGVAGTKCSSVIVALRGSEAWEDAATIVHELGHFIGLEHTTEFGGSGDALSDTPTCTSTGKGELSSCPDFDNLMFPTTSVGSAPREVVVSPTQKRVMTRSPIYRPR